LLRWKIAVLVSVAIAISYMDRQTLPVAVRAIAKDIPLSNVQFSTHCSRLSCLLTHSCIAGGGKLTDALGTRLGFTVLMIFWSLACASHALGLGPAPFNSRRLLDGLHPALAPRPIFQRYAQIR
jgi:ACS family hexuronate transporter-like MFS transporter